MTNTEITVKGEEFLEIMRFYFVGFHKNSFGNSEEMEYSSG